jgi:hypothetical protein
MGMKKGGGRLTPNPPVKKNNGNKNQKGSGRGNSGESGKPSEGEKTTDR